MIETEHRRNLDSPPQRVRRFYRSRIVAVAALSYLVSISEAFAAEGHHIGSVWDIKFHWINFLVYIAIVYIASKGVISSAWATRRDRIKQAVRHSAEELEHAEKELKQVEILTRNVVAAEAAAQQEILQQAESEAQTIVATAKEKAIRIAEQAGELIEAEANAARHAIRDELVSRAVELAKKRFGSGELASKQEQYAAAAIARARQLVR